MKKRPKKEGKIKRSKNKPKGLRLRKTVRGKVISQEIVQINLKILKEGKKKLVEVFPEQNKTKEVEKQKEETKAPEVKQETKKIEETSVKETKTEKTKEESKEKKKV